MEQRGLVLAGWYHSHPKCQPDPSLKDIESQMEYQHQLKGSPNTFQPCFAIIVCMYIVHCLFIVSLNMSGRNMFVFAYQSDMNRLELIFRLELRPYLSSSSCFLLVLLSNQRCSCFPTCLFKLVFNCSWSKDRPGGQLSSCSKNHDIPYPGIMAFPAFWMG